MDNSLSVIYRLADTDDALNLAALLWEQINEFDQRDAGLRNEYINDCYNHIGKRLGNDLFCFIAEENSLIVSHIFILITPKLPKLGRPSEDSIGYYECTGFSSKNKIMEIEFFSG